ncbi:MAG: YciI family protein [Devosia sp.]
MRYFMTIMIDAAHDAETTAVPKAVEEAVDPFVEKHIASGALISTGGLKRSRTATRLVGRAGEIAVIDGPFAEAKEVFGGYAVLEVPSQEAAVAIAEEFVRFHTDNGMDCLCEVREFHGGYNI